MPSKSTKQKQLMCIAQAIKHGKKPASYSPQAAIIAGQMSEQQLKEFCEAPVEKEQ
jgi:hypothetical protein